MNELRSIAPQAKTGSAAAVVVDDVPLVHTAQVFAPADITDPAQAVDDVLRRTADVLAAAKSQLGRVVRWHFYVATDADAAVVQRKLAERYDDSYRPAVTYAAGKLAEAGSLIAADCVAVAALPAADRTVVRFPGAAVLPPTHKLYISGDARSGELDVAARGTLEALENSLRFAGLDWSDVVQLKTFLTPIDGAAAVRRVMARFFGERPVPVLTFVEWKSSGVPIEIELVAAAKPEAVSATETVEFLTPTGMTSSPVFSRAARVHSAQTIYTSGLYGEGATDAPGRVRAILSQLGDLSKQTGGDLKHLVKATYYCSSDESSGLLNKIRPEYYDPQRPPAASKAIVAGVGRPDCDLTVDMILVPAPPAR